MQLPMTIEGITKEWVGEALSQNRSQVVVDSLEILNVLHGGATKIQVRLKYGQGTGSDLPETMWVKIGFEPHHEYVETVLNAYTAEARAYNEIIPLYNINTPRAFFAQAQKSPAQGAVILEDLLVRDVRFNVVLSPLTIEEVAAGLESLAQQHGQSWGDPRLQDIAGLEHAMRGPMQRVFDDFVNDAEQYFHALRGYAVPIALHDQAKLAAGLKAYTAQAAKGPDVFLHADTHVGNSFKEKDGSVRFLDWQMACKGHWSHDVAHFIGSALDVLDRRRGERQLIEHYLVHLEKNGGAAPKFAEAWDDYRRAIFYGFIVWLGNADGWQIPQINLANFTRFGYAMLDHDTYSLLGV